MMAVTMHKRLALELGKFEMSCMLCKKFAEQEGLLAESPGFCIAREKVDEFIAEDCNTAQLKSIHGYALGTLWPQGIEDVLDQWFSHFPHPLLVHQASPQYPLLLSPA